MDRHIGSLLTALRARSRFAGKDWLVLASTDHRGTGKTDGEHSVEARAIRLLARGGQVSARARGGSRDATDRLPAHHSPPSQRSASGRLDTTLCADGEVIGHAAERVRR